MLTTLLLDPDVVGPTRAVVALTRGNRRRVGIRTLVSLLEGVSESAALLLLGNVALGVAGGDDGLVLPRLGGLSSTSTLLVYVILLVLTRFVLGLVSARLSSKIASDIGLTIRSQMVSAYSKADYLTREGSDLGGLMQRVSLWPLAIGATTGTLLGYLSNAVITTSMLVVAFVRDPLVSLFVIFLTAALFALFIPLRRYIRRLSGVLLARQDSTARSLDELHRLGAEAEAFGVLPSLRDRTLCAFRRESDTWRQANFVKSSVSPTYVAVSLSAIAIGLGLLSRQSPEALTSLGPTLLVVLRSLSYGQGLQQATTTLSSLIPTLREVAAAQLALQNSRRRSGLAGALPFHSLRLEKVTFTYCNDRAGGLRDISIEISRGDRIGIIGPSGGGKSTLAKVIVGLINPTDGHICLNGQDQSEISWSSRTECFAYVPQFAKLMSGSLEDNAVFFRAPRAGRTAEESLTASGLLPDHLVFPSGLITHVDPNSAQLSGGQIQRLALARALWGQPEVVVLDEPTSSVDSVSEAHIRRVLGMLDEEVTLVIVSHKAELLQLCTKLAVVEEGQITNFGPPSEVVRASSFAHGMFS